MNMKYDFTRGIHLESQHGDKIALPLEILRRATILERTLMSLP